MRYNVLGETGLFVSELCLGTMTFGGGEGMWEQIGALAAGGGRRPPRARRSMPASTSSTPRTSIPPASGDDHSGRRSAISASRAMTWSSRRRCSAAWARVRTAAAPRAATSSTQVKASLKRLQLEHIDLYQIHGFDRVTPIEETLEALDALVRQGLVRYVGVSNWAAWQVAKAQGIAERARARSGPLAAGLLHAGRPRSRARDRADAARPKGRPDGLEPARRRPPVRQVRPRASGRRRRTAGDLRLPAGRPRPRLTASSPPCAPLAEARGATVAQVALAWLLHQPVVTSVIVGAKRREQLTENMAAAEIALAAEDLAALDAASALPRGIPGLDARAAGREPRRGAAAAVTGGGRPARMDAGDRGGSGARQRRRPCLTAWRAAQRRRPERSSFAPTRRPPRPALSPRRRRSAATVLPSGCFPDRSPGRRAS